MKATIIHNVYLTHKNGLNTVLGLLLKNKNIFFDNGIELCSVTPDDEGVRNFTSKKKLQTVYKRFCNKYTNKMRASFWMGSSYYDDYKIRAFFKKNGFEVYSL